MNELIDLILLFGGGLFVIFSGDIISHMKRFKGRSTHERQAYAIVLILAVMGPIALVYTLWKTGRL